VEAAANGTSGMDGDIAERFVITSALSDSPKIKVLNYLQQNGVYRVIILERR
jgi:hypothetical protein